MKKVIFVILIIVCFAINASSATYSRIHYFEVSEANGPIYLPTDIWRSPSQNNISFQEDLGYGNIAIYHNGNEIVNENPLMNLGDSVIYNLSEYGCGEYEIVITTADNETYVGLFSSLMP